MCDSCELQEVRRRQLLPYGKLRELNPHKREEAHQEMNAWQPVESLYLLLISHGGVSLGQRKKLLTALCPSIAGLSMY